MLSLITSAPLLVNIFVVAIILNSLYFRCGVFDTIQLRISLWLSFREITHHRYRSVKPILSMVPMSRISSQPPRNICIQLSASMNMQISYPELVLFPSITLEVRNLPVALLEHTRMITLVPRLASLSGIMLSPKAIWLCFHFLLLTLICYLPGGLAL